MSNPLGKIKGVAVESVRHPRQTANKAAGEAIDLATGAVHRGKHAAGQATGVAKHTVDALTSWMSGSPPAEAEDEPAPPPPTKKAPAKKAPAKKAPAKKAPAKKTAAKKAAAKKTAKKAPPKKAAPRAEAPPAPPEPPADEPLIDPATTKAVASEAETMGRAADPDPQ